MMASLLCAFPLLFTLLFFWSMMYLLLGNITLSELIILQGYYSQSLPWLVCVLDTHRPVSVFTVTAF